MQLIIRDEFVVLVGARGEQWLLQLDVRGNVVQRRAQFSAGSLAKFIGADVGDRIDAGYMEAVVFAWNNAQTAADLGMLLKCGV